MNATLDAPGTVCALASRHCTGLVAGVGGFDQHHPVPVELGGDPNQPLLALCPIHHRRQHAGIRFLVENNGEWSKPVARRYMPDERTLIDRAYAAWVANGKPQINGWPCPAARGN